MSEKEEIKTATDNLENNKENEYLSLWDVVKIVLIVKFIVLNASYYLKHRL